MSNLTRALMMGAAGAASGDKVYVDEVFSTFLYEGNGGTQSINNGIDLAGEGGLVWFKKRNGGTYAGLWDTARGVTKRLRPDNNYAESDASNLVTAFNSNGVSISATGGTQINNNNDDYVSWTFRKAPGFFDIQTWTGNGAARTIAHNLGSVPGMILVKPVGFAENWKVWHRNLPNTATDFLTLNETGSKESSSTIWNNTAPTSTHFSLGNNLSVNGGGNSDYTYIAYIFAHDDAQYGKSGNESIIKCGSYTSNGSEQEINLGFEPQFILIKSSSHAGGWYLFDSMRGIFTGSVEPSLQTQETNAEAADNNGNIALTATGFRTDYNGGGLNNSGRTYIYMAIRRPHKPPEVGTEVFQASAASSYAGTDDIPCNFAPDFFIAKTRSQANSFYAEPRLTNNWLVTNGTDAESSTNYFDWDGPGGKINLTGTSFSGDPIFWQFKRAPGFMDVVAYTGDGTYDGSYSVNHNLEVVPEMIIAKNRGSTNFWNVYHSGLTSDTYQVNLNRNSAQLNTGQSWGPAAASFKPQYAGNSDYSSNHSGQNYVAYLFATLSGISKVGSYSGTGNDINVDCGFTAGARFVLIKCIDDVNGDWYVWDSVRGIVSGNDPYLLLNSNAAQVTNTDYVDPLNAGFTVTSSAPAALNASGGTYLFLAIA